MSGTDKKKATGTVSSSKPKATVTTQLKDKYAAAPKWMKLVGWVILAIFIIWLLGVLARQWSRMRDKRQKGREKIVMFDLIGTLFAIEQLQPALYNLGLTDPESAQCWFNATLRDGNALSLTSQYKPFSLVATSNLLDMLQRHGLPAPPDKVQTAIAAFQRIPMRADSAAALLALRIDNWCAVTLSNAEKALAVDLLAQNGASDLVKQVISVDDPDIRRWTPDRRAYSGAATLLGVDPNNVWYVSSQPWDIQGARYAGMKTIYVRPFPTAIYPGDMFALPDAEVSSFDELVQTLKQRHSALLL